MLVQSNKIRWFMVSNALQKSKNKDTIHIRETTFRNGKIESIR